MRTRAERRESEERVRRGEDAREARDVRRAMFEARRARAQVRRSAIKATF